MRRAGVAVPGEGPAEWELRRLGRRCAAVLRVSVAVVAGVLALVVARSFASTLVAVAVLALWSAVYLGLTFRHTGNWLLFVDVGVVCAVCLTQRWTVPPAALHGSMSWVVGVASIAVAVWQWHGSARAGGIAVVAVVVAYVAGSAMAPGSPLVALWLGVEAALSRGLYHLVRAGARESDRIMADAENTRREATVAAARRGHERAHLAAVHDTAAAVMLAIGTGVVDGREPWLAKQLTDALDELTDAAPTAHGLADLVPLLTEVVRHSPVRAELSTTELAPGTPAGSVGGRVAEAAGVARRPAAGVMDTNTPLGETRGELPSVVVVAICRAVHEALLNVARHAGVGTASVRLERRADRVVVEVVDGGRGFAPDTVSSQRRGISLSLVERMASVGGRAQVTSGVGRGTRVRLEWPDG